MSGNMNITLKERKKEYELRERKKDREACESKACF
jgi:hypothetical protein